MILPRQRESPVLNIGHFIGLAVDEEIILEQI